MRILVLGAGQGGTCPLTEAVRGLGVVSFTERVEDRKFFKYKDLPENYGTKLTTDSIARITPSNFSSFLERLRMSMERYDNLHLVFSLRHPLDIFMAQLVRGQKPSEGGDGRIKDDKVSDSGTIDGSIFAIKHYYNVYKNIVPHFPRRVLIVKMEGLILKPEEEVDRIAEYFGVKATQRAYEFYKHGRNRYHIKRYGDRLDKSVVALHKKWDTWHDGFFKDRKGAIDFAMLHLADIIKEWGYEDALVGQ